MKRSVFTIASAIAVTVAVMLILAIWIRFAAPPSEDLPTLSGQRGTRSYDLTGFTQIEVRGQWQVKLVRGDAWAVEAAFPIELERFLEVRKNGDALVLGHNFARGWWSDFGSNEELAITARIVMPALEEIDLSGASKVELSGFDGAELEVDASGASVLEGNDSRYHELDFSMSGAGVADFSGVTTTDARVGLSGASNVTLRMAGGSLSGNVSGVSNLVYFGNVSSQDVGTSGVAHVEHRE